MNYTNPEEDQRRKEEWRYKNKIERILKGKSTLDDGKNKKLTETRYIP